MKNFFHINGWRGGARSHDLRFNRPSLLPTELHSNIRSGETGFWLRDIPFASCTLVVDWHIVHSCKLYPTCTEPSLSRFEPLRKVYFSTRVESFASPYHGCASSFLKTGGGSGCVLKEPFGWWIQWESNPWPSACRADALPNWAMNPYVCQFALLFLYTAWPLSPLRNSGRLTDKSMLSRCEIYISGGETDWLRKLDSNQRNAAVKALCRKPAWRFLNIKLQLATPVRAILDCEFVDGSGSHERLILHRLFLTYLLYHIFLIFSTNYPCSTF